MTPAETAVAALPDTPARLHWLTVQFRKSLALLGKRLDAGMNQSQAFELCSDELTRLYRQSCTAELAPPVNAMLDPTAIELQARFALDAAITAVKARLTESEVRQHFWGTFRKATNPHAV